MRTVIFGVFFSFTAFLYFFTFGGGFNSQSAKYLKCFPDLLGETELSCEPSVIPKTVTELYGNNWPVTSLYQVFTSRPETSLLHVNGKLVGLKQTLIPVNGDSPKTERYHFFQNTPYDKMALSSQFIEKDVLRVIYTSTLDKTQLMKWDKETFERAVTHFLGLKQNNFTLDKLSVTPVARPALLGVLKNLYTKKKPKDLETKEWVAWRAQAVKRLNTVNKRLHRKVYQTLFKYFSQVKNFFRFLNTVGPELEKADKKVVAAFFKEANAGESPLQYVQDWEKQYYQNPKNKIFNQDLLELLEKNLVVLEKQVLLEKELKVPVKISAGNPKWAWGTVFIGRVRQVEGHKNVQVKHFKHLTGDVITLEDIARGVSPEQVQKFCSDNEGTLSIYLNASKVPYFRHPAVWGPSTKRTLGKVAKGMIKTALLEMTCQHFVFYTETHNMLGKLTQELAKLNFENMKSTANLEIANGTHRTVRLLPGVYSIRVSEIFDNSVFFEKEVTIEGPRRNSVHFKLQEQKTVKKD